MYNFKFSTTPKKIFYGLNIVLLILYLIATISTFSKLSSLESEVGATSYEITYITPTIEFAGTNYVSLYEGTADSRFILYDENGELAVTTEDEIRSYIVLNSYVDDITGMISLFLGIGLCILVILTIFEFISKQKIYFYLIAAVSMLIQIIFMKSDSFTAFWLSLSFSLIAILLTIRAHIKINEENNLIKNRYN